MGKFFAALTRLTRFSSEPVARIKVIDTGPAPLGAWRAHCYGPA